MRRRALAPAEGWLTLGCVLLMVEQSPQGEVQLKKSSLVHHASSRTGCAPWNCSYG